MVFERIISAQTLGSWAMGGQVLKCDGITREGFNRFVDYTESFGYMVKRSPMGRTAKSIPFAPMSFMSPNRAVSQAK